MGHLRRLIESRDYLSRVPGQSLVADPLTGADHISATRGNGYAFIYSAQGRPFTINLGKISGGQVKTSWFNPRTGTTSEAGTFTNTGTRDLKVRSGQQLFRANLKPCGRGGMAYAPDLSEI